MSEESYNRSYSALHSADPPGFDSQFEQDQFRSEVDTNVGITPNLLRIDRTGDSIDIVFDVALSGGEETTLNGLIANHTPDTTPKNLTDILYSVKGNSTRNTEYAVADRLIFPGGTFARLNSISYMDTGVTSYSIKIFDRTNNQTIVEGTLSNTSDGMQTLGVGSNISSTKAMWEIHFKKTGGSNQTKAYLDTIHIEFV